MLICEHLNHRNLLKMVSSGALLLMAGIACSAAASFAQSSNLCTEMTKFKLPGVQLEITKAAWVPVGPSQGMGPGAAVTLPHGSGWQHLWHRIRGLIA
jgi:hypothetical protein